LYIKLLLTCFELVYQLGHFVAQLVLRRKQSEEIRTYIPRGPIPSLFTNYPRGYIPSLFTDLPSKDPAKIRAFLVRTN
jgi:hypothetical protein